MAYNITLKQKQKKSSNTRSRVPIQAGEWQANNSLRNSKLVTGPPPAIGQVYVVCVNGTSQSGSVHNPFKSTVTLTVSDRGVLNFVGL